MFTPDGVSDFDPAGRAFQITASRFLFLQDDLSFEPSFAAHFNRHESPHLLPHSRKRSTSSHLQRSFRKAGSFELQLGRSFVNLLEVVLGQFDIHRAEVFLKPM